MKAEPPEIIDNSNAPKRRPVFRVLLRLLFFLVVFFILAITGGAFIAYYYQDEVKEYVVGELNKQLNTQIIVDGKDIDFTVIKNFPYASVDFKNVKALEAVEQKKKDTLFSAGRISFQFNLVDVFKKKYDIKKIQVDNADFKIKIDKDGNDNYHILKPTADTAKTAFSFALKKIVLTEIHLSYKNKKTDQHIDLTIHKSVSSGKFSNDNYTLESNTELFLKEFVANKISYVNKKNIVATLAVDIDNKSHIYQLKKGDLKVENMIFNLSGNVLNKVEESELMIKVKGEKMDIQSVLSLIPEQHKAKIKDYKSSGEFYFDAMLEGIVSKNNVPQITADFGIKNAEITHIPNDIELKHVNLLGHYYSGDKTKSQVSFLEITPFEASIDDGHVSGAFSLKDLSNPFVKAQLKGNTLLSKIQKFVALDTVESIDGQLEMELSFSGLIKELTENNYQQITANGNLKVMDGKLKIKNNSLEFKNIDGDFTFDNNDLIINSFNAIISKSDIALKGVLKNSMGFLLRENEDVTINATLQSNNLDLNELLANKDESAKTKSKYKLKFSERVNINFNSTIQHIEFRKFEANNVQGVLRLKNKKMSVDTLAFNTLDGRVNLGGLVDLADSSQVLISCFSDLNNISITKLFTAFENFDQTVVIDKNIKGVATASIQFAAVFTPELDIDLNKLYAGIDLTIDNGELNKIESFKKLSRFVELTDLENIRFKSLKNKLEIKNNQIIIPKMEIKSNALDFLASGTHTFDNEVDYKIKLSLNDLLAKKIKKPKKSDTAFGEVADDGLGRTNVYLTMKGPMDNPVIRYDTKSAIESVKLDLKVEKQTLKQILKDEFGLFKKDTSLQNKVKAKKEEEAKFIIKWEEADVKEEKKELQKPKKPVDDDF